MDSKDLSRHYFLDLSLFLKKFWTAEIRNGLDLSFTLQDFLWEGHKMHMQNRRQTGIKQASNRHQLYDASWILDHRLSACKDKEKGVLKMQ